MMRLLPICFSLLLAGCAGDPPAQAVAPAPTVVHLRIVSAGDSNPDSAGNAAPLMLRIYELREQSSFNAADFFTLFDKDQATLAADLQRRQELLLKPGDSRTLTLQPADEVRTLGFFGAFRQLDTAQWRATADLLPHQTQQLTIKVNANRLTVETSAATH